MMEKSTAPEATTVVVDHVFRPYCSGYNLLKSVLGAFENVEIRRFDVTAVDERRLAELPSHVEAAIRDGEPSGYGGVFYVNGRLTRADTQSLEDAIGSAGGSRLPDASIWHHPLPGRAEMPPGLHVRRIPEEDVAGNGEPLPTFWCDLNAADPEVREFLLRATRKQGCCMVGAYIDRQVSGFMTFFTAESKEIPDAQLVSDGTLRIACLHVFPHKRRQGVAAALLNEVVTFAREQGYRRVIANAGYIDIGDNFKGTPPGSRSVYQKLGFKMTQFREPERAGDEGEAFMELILS